MTTKEASRIFHIDEREIRKRYGDGMIIAAYKDGNFIVVPDETEIIPSKQEIKSFLLQIIKIKNNSTYLISRSMCPDMDTLKALLHYLYQRGMIGKYEEASSEAEMLANVQLTDDGFAYILGEKAYAKLNCGFSIPITLKLGGVVL